MWYIVNITILIIAVLELENVTRSKAPDQPHRPRDEIPLLTLSGNMTYWKCNNCIIDVRGLQGRRSCILHIVLLIVALLSLSRELLFSEASQYYLWLVKMLVTLPESRWTSDKREGKRWKAKLHWRSLFRTSNRECFSQQSAGLQGDGVVISWQRGAGHVGTSRPTSKTHQTSNTDFTHTLYHLFLFPFLSSNLFSSFSIPRRGLQLNHRIYFSTYSQSLKEKKSFESEKSFKLLKTIYWKEKFSVLVSSFESRCLSLILHFPFHLFRPCFFKFIFLFLLKSHQIFSVVELMSSCEGWEF